MKHLRNTGRRVDHRWGERWCRWHSLFSKDLILQCMRSLSLNLSLKLRLMEISCELRYLVAPLLFPFHLLPLVFLCLESLLRLELADFGLMMLLCRVQFHIDTQVLLVNGGLHRLSHAMKFCLE